MEFPKDEALNILNDLERRAIKMMTAETFPPRPNDKCCWCHFRKGNGGNCKFGA